MFVVLSAHLLYVFVSRASCLLQNGSQPFLQSGILPQIGVCLLQADLGPAHSCSSRPGVTVFSNMVFPLSSLCYVCPSVLGSDGLPPYLGHAQGMGSLASCPVVLCISSFNII